MPRKLVMTRQVRDWLRALRAGDAVTRRLVAQAIDRLLDEAPGSAARWSTGLPGRGCIT